jgi:hypothetical protein
MGTFKINDIEYVHTYEANQPNETEGYEPIETLIGFLKNLQNDISADNKLFYQFDSDDRLYIKTARVMTDADRAEIKLAELRYKESTLTRMQKNVDELTSALKNQVLEIEKTLAQIKADDK